MDDRTGNAARDGYTRVGSRRPRSSTPGEMVSEERASMIEDFDDKYGDQYIGFVD